MTRRRWLAVIVIVLVMLAIGIMDAFAPSRTASTTTVGTIDASDAVATVKLTLDTLDAPRNSLKLRLDVGQGGTPLPPEGATLLTNLPGLGTTVLPIEPFSAERTSEVIVDTGDIVDYPLDRYEEQIGLALLKGKVPAGTDPATATSLPMAVTMLSSLASFDVTAEPKEEGKTVVIETVMVRRPITVWWAFTMMGIFWLLAISATAVVVATIMRLRVFETRHLAWLAAMIFAFAAFRTTAPGTPPIGVYMDFASFFWSEMLVAASLLALVIYYLASRREPTA